MSVYNPGAWENGDLENLYKRVGWSDNRNNIINLLKKYSEDDFLDVGCLDGAYIKRLREEGYVGSYHGVDITKRHIDIAKANVVGEKFKQGDARKLKFKDRSFKTVLFSDVIQHLPEPVGPISEICRVADKYVILSTYGSRKETFTRHNNLFMNTYYSEEDIRRIIPHTFNVIDFFDLEHPTVSEKDSVIRIYHFVLERI
jgi:ubiquinone/menaquinone biosynthesis C-methylase UbiE